MEYSVSCRQIRPLSLFVFYSHVLWPVSEIFHAHPRNYTLLVEKAYLSVCLHFVFLHHGCQVTAHPSLCVTPFHFHSMSSTLSHCYLA